MIISFIKNSNCIDIRKWMGFCIGAVFTEKKIGTYISHGLIVWLTPTWIWYDILIVSDFCRSNQQLSFFLNLSVQSSTTT